MKIADFGLARDVHNIDYYKKTTNVSPRRVSAVFSLLLEVCVWVFFVQNGSVDQCGSVVAGSSAREMDGSGGSVRPGLHAPERCVSLHKQAVTCQLSTHVEPPYTGGIWVLKYHDGAR